MNKISTSLKIVFLCMLVLSILMLTGCDFSFMGIENPEPNSGDVISSGEEIENSGEEIVPADTDHLYTEVRVSSVKDLFSNIRPYTRIILTEDYYNTSYINAATFKSVYVVANDSYDGYEYAIRNVTDLEICADPNVLPELVTTSSHANVISLINCKNVKISGIVAGHEVEKGSCIGGVVYLDECEDIEIDSCHLYGCGTYGVSAFNSSNIKVTNTEIYDCTYGLVDLNNSRNIEFSNCSMKDSMEYNLFSISNCSKIDFNNCTIDNNYCSSYSSFISCSGCRDVNFTKCIFSNNIYSDFIFDTNDSCKFNACKIQDPIEITDYYGEENDYGEFYYPDIEPDYDYEEVQGDI